jgi:hypothetical protein
VLSAVIDNTKGTISKLEEKLAQLNFSLNNTQGAMKKIDFYYDRFQGWADVYDNESLEQKKIILCQLIKEINVSRGYELDIVLDMSYAQFLCVS